MAELPITMTFRVERTEYADIEVDVPRLIAEWGTEGAPIESRDDVLEILAEIGVQDLMFSGDFISVRDRDSDESIA